MKMGKGVIFHSGNKPGLCVHGYVRVTGGLLGRDSDVRSPGGSGRPLLRSRGGFPG